MDKAKKIISSFFSQNDSKLEAFLTLDGKKYEISNFHIVFGQPVDFKGQPQHEVGGGQFSLTFKQSLDDSCYVWAKRANELKSGVIQFVTETEGTKLEIEFSEAACTTLLHKVNAFSGLEVSLAISSAALRINGISHHNKWKLD